MLNANRFKLGLFVLIGIFLIGGALLIHGLGSVFQEKYELYTVFDESVQGLEIGSDVKFKGVKLGNVSAIDIYKDQYVKVMMEIVPTTKKAKKRERSEDLSDSKRRQEAYRFLKEQIKKGLVCELTMAGITGMKFIELTFEKDQKRVVDLKLKDDGYIPSNKGLLEGTMLSLNEAISKIAQMDFKGISDELKGTLQTVNKTLNKPQVDSAMTDMALAAKDLRNILGTINKSFESQVIEKTLVNIEKSFEEIRTLAKTMNSEIKKVQLAKLSANATTSLKSISGAAEQFDKSIASIEKEFNTTLKSVQLLSGEVIDLKKDFKVYGKSLGVEGKVLQADFQKVLGRLETALSSIEIFFKMLEKDPGSILHGKSGRK
ncbi:MAG: MlaD family protein [Lentisphaeraceae bacterium]|nr:MlaD family protein [Lentisphaeraceae bacterium]